mmetsp:Transcript_85071/g.227408  ORF Transcript_85071/g.227408 Transcript_85071/m.227408 type:complete len:324 (-) Transcript_85071:214-1185(-)
MVTPPGRPRRKRPVTAHAGRPKMSEAEEARREKGNTMLKLMCATKQGRLKQLQEALEEGDVEINTRLALGWTFASIAADAGQVEMLNWLLQNNADPDTRNDQNDTLLHMGLKAGHKDCLGILRTVLAKSKRNLEVQNEDGQTPLMLAAASGNIEAAELLLKKGGNVNVTDAEDQTPLMLAVVQENPEMLQVILEHNPDLDAQGGFHGLTALGLAAASDRWNNVELLAAAGAVDRPSRSGGLTALMLAAASGDVHRVEQLLAGASKGPECLGARNDAGFTAAVMAAASGHRPVVERLLQEGPEADDGTASTLLAAMEAEQMAEG